MKEWKSEKINGKIPMEFCNSELLWIVFYNFFIINSFILLIINWGVFMKILIVGLGVIGGSFAMALKAAGYEDVYGIDNNLSTLSKAEE